MRGRRLVLLAVLPLIAAVVLVVAVGIGAVAVPPLELSLIHI